MLANVPNTLEAFGQGRKHVRHRLKCTLARCMCPQPDYWSVTLRGREGSRAVQNISAFLRKHPPPTCPSQMSAGTVTWQGKWQRKEQSRQLSILFFTPLPEVKCVYADVGDEQKPGYEELNGHLPGPSLWEHICPFRGPAPWPACLPLPSLLPPPWNTKSRLCG